MKIKRTVKDYLWFIKESQSFMEGHNKVKIFLLSLIKGFKFCYYMNKHYKHVNGGC